MSRSISWFETSALDIELIKYIVTTQESQKSSKRLPAQSMIEICLSLSSLYKIMSDLWSSPWNAKLFERFLKFLLKYDFQEKKIISLKRSSSAQTFPCSKLITEDQFWTT